MRALENRWRVSVLTSREDIGIDTCRPEIVEMMLNDEATENAAGVAGLWDSKNRQLRPSSTFGETRTIELDPAGCPTHKGARTVAVVGGHGKRACRVSVGLDLFPNSQERSRQLVSEPALQSCRSKVHAGCAERSRLHTPTQVRFVVRGLRDYIDNATHGL